MIIDNGESNISGGILIDWDLSKFVNTQAEHPVARQHTRTVSQVSEPPLYPFSPDVYYHQGTWQFMAGDLVLSPGDPQTFVHDLESAFWILFYLTLLFVKTNYTAELRSSLLRQTMSPMNIKGCGGVDKANFMASQWALAKVRTPDNPMVIKVLRFLHLKLGERYRTQPDAEIEVSAPASSTLDSSMSNATNGSTGKDSVTQTPDEIYEEIFRGLTAFLAEPSWTESDPAEAQEVLLSTTESQAARRGSKRSRSVAEQLGAFVQEPGAKRSDNV